MPESLPEYDNFQSFRANFNRFFEWALALPDPTVQIPLASQAHGLPVREHPLGFKVAYLSPPYEGVRTPEISGLVRANIYPEDAPLEPDIHAHGFDSVSGVVQGRLISHFYDVESSLLLGKRTAPGKGYTGYLNTTDHFGNNHSQLLTKADIAIPSPHRILVVRRGEQYSQQAQIDYHRVASRGAAISIFAKSASGFDTSESRAYVFRASGHASPPERY